MKLAIFPIVFLLFLPSLSQSQSAISDSSMSWMKGWTNFDPNHEAYPEADRDIPNIIDEDTYLSNEFTYLLSGNVYVINGATLTIEEGTILRCDTETPTSLVVTSGSRLIARGLKGTAYCFYFRQIS